MSDRRGKRALKLNGEEAVETYLDAHPEDLELVGEALMCIQEGSWASHYRHLDDVTNPYAVIMFLRPDLVMVWRILTEYPEYFRVVWIGSPDGY